ncbi:MAG: acetyl-CoA decarbonylase/synthase complex subunit gamma, partial [Candidatus Gastranaerophilaceae bacterium]
MALSGLQIFKLLPGGKKEKEANCKQCGFPTCMAFAMKLAKGEASIDSCQFISDELRAMLVDAGQKQQEEIVFGPELNRIKTGNETVMFRHDKTFINSTCISVCLDSNDSNFESKLNEISSYSIERVGENFTVSAIALYDNGDFEERAQIVNEKNIPLILISNDFKNLSAALEKIKKSKPLVFLETTDTEKIAEISKKYEVPVVVSAKSLEELAEISEKLLTKEIKDIVLNLDEEVNFSTIESLTFIRRAAIEEKFKPLGFPLLMKVPQSNDIIQDAVLSSALLCKYSNILLLENFDKALLSGLFSLSQNIYTDPQKPLQVEAKLYEVGEVTPDSPIFITTNFALTYFAVVSELEAS